jgi:hypothetical protein
MDQLVNGTRRLSNQLLARLFIVAQDVHRYHIFVNACHCIIDGISIRLLIQTILEELSSAAVARRRWGIQCMRSCQFLFLQATVHAAWRGASHCTWG